MRKQGLAANVTDQKLTQVVLNGSGNPQEIQYLQQRTATVVKRLTRPPSVKALVSPVESYRQAVAFGRMCCAGHDRIRAAWFT